MYQYTSYEPKSSKVYQAWYIEMFFPTVISDDLSQAHSSHQNSQEVSLQNPGGTIRNKDWNSLQVRLDWLKTIMNSHVIKIH